MTIKRFGQDWTESLVGKYGHLSTIMADMEVGPPVLFTKVSVKRAYYTQIPKEWNTETKSREFRKISDVPPEDHTTGYCAVDTTRFICDTMEEAVMVYKDAFDLWEEIRKYKEDARRRFYQKYLPNTEE